MSTPLLILSVFLSHLCGWSWLIPPDFTQRLWLIDCSVGAFFPFQFHCFLFFLLFISACVAFICPFPPLGSWVLEVFPLSKYVWLAVSPALPCCARSLSLCCCFLTCGYLGVYCLVFRILEMFLVVFLALIWCCHSKEYSLYNFSIPLCPYPDPAWTRTHAR